MTMTTASTTIRMERMLEILDRDVEYYDKRIGDDVDDYDDDIIIINSYR